MAIRRSKGIKFFSLFIALFLSGTAGFMVVEEWNFLDSFFMTAITLTTVGYGEVNPLSDAGRYFTIVLMLFGITFFTYLIREIVASQMFIDFDQRRRKRMQKKINQLSNHTVVCGYGRMGQVVCDQLDESDSPFVVIEKRQELLEQLKMTPYHWVAGDASEDDLLIEAGIEQARSIVSCIDNDADSLYVLLAAKNINPGIFSVARASTETARVRMLRMGANRVILPLTMSGRKVAQTILNPAVEDIVDLTGFGFERDDLVQVVDVPVSSDSRMVGKTLADSGLRQRNHFLIVGIKRADKDFMFAPNSDEVFRPGDLIVGMCRRTNYDEVKALFS